MYFALFNANQITNKCDTFIWSYVFLFSNHLNTKTWIPDSIGVRYSNGKAMWLGRTFEYWKFWTINRLFSVWFSDHYSNTTFDNRTKIYYLNTRLVLYSYGYLFYWKNGQNVVLWKVLLTTWNWVSKRMLHFVLTLRQGSAIPILQRMQWYNLNFILHKMQWYNWTWECNDKFELVNSSKWLCRNEESKK